MSDEPLPGDPYADYAQQHMDPALATLTLAYEVRTLIMLEHPHVEHETVTNQMKDNNT